MADPASGGGGEHLIQRAVKDLEPHAFAAGLFRQHPSPAPGPWLAGKEPKHVPGDLMKPPA